MEERRIVIITSKHGQTDLERASFSLLDAVLNRSDCCIILNPACAPSFVKEVATRKLGTHKHMVFPDQSIPPWVYDMFPAALYAAGLVGHDFLSCALKWEEDNSSGMVAQPQDARRPAALKLLTS